jgi:TRAP-type C4-dicarboxylate transport system substrate-binding protein
MFQLLRFIGVVATMAYAATAQAQTELSFGHVGEPGSLFEASANEFAKRANEKLGPDYKVVAFGSSQLGSDEQMVQKLKLGQLDFSLPSTVMSSVTPEFGVFEMPYIVKDREHMKRVRDAILESVLQPAVKAKGYRILAGSRAVNGASKCSRPMEPTRRR